jgi:hypothetical protein
MSVIFFHCIVFLFVCLLVPLASSKTSVQSSCQTKVKNEEETIFLTFFFSQGVDASRCIDQTQFSFRLLNLCVSPFTKIPSKC